jgi:hypothetical protein
MQITEQQESELLATYLRIKGYKFTHIPNETGSDPAAKRRAIRMKRAGTSKGFPDYLIFANGKSIAIELKSRRKGAKATPEQKEWLLTLSEYGFESAICHGSSEAIEFIDSVI